MKGSEYYLKQCYEKAIANSKDFTDFEPLADFMLCALAHRKESFSYVDKLESELINRGLLHEKINERRDFIKNHTFNKPEFDRMLYYISLVRDPHKV